MKKPNSSTSWEPASEWYHDLVGSDGHYYHQHLIFPLLSKLLATRKENLSLLDLGCGQGVLSDALPKNYSYVGVDVSPSLIKLAKKTHQLHPEREFYLQDVCVPFDLGRQFTHATMILSFQNMEEPKTALENIKKHLKQGGSLILVLNHPCFRIPRQSSWQVDPDKKLQYRRIDSYQSSAKIPIDIHPGQKDKTVTYSFHRSLAEIFSLLKDSGFVVADLIELTSDKTSTGKSARMENRARVEIPLFMVLVAKSL